MQIAIIGSGYVGLVSGACLADFGHHVTCVDTDHQKVTCLSRGEIPIYEPGLKEMVEHNVSSGRLCFTTELSLALQKATVVFVCVGTPPGEDGQAAMTAVFAAVRGLVGMVTEPTTLVMKSTVPVGTSDAVEEIIAQENPKVKITVVSNPEFLREGAAIHDFKHPDRIVVGTDDAEALEVMQEIYRPLFINSDPIMHTGRRAAEMIKYASNAFLATKITFINEMADLCEKVGANVQEVARGIGLDNRIGRKFLHAGPGYGGSCFPKDTQALLHTAKDHGASLRIVETVVAVNQDRKSAMAKRVIAAMGGDVRGRTVAILGLTFKPNTDDMREAPSLVIIPELQAAGALIRAYDPEGMPHAASMLTGVTFCEDAYECATCADAVVLITEWEEFRALDVKRIYQLTAQPVFVDMRNVYKPADMAAQGFAYQSIGRPQ